MAKIKIMILVLRIILTALWLIFTGLIFTGFQPGGRYLILFEAVAAALITCVIRSFICKDMEYRARGFLSAIGVIFGLALVRLVFSGIRLTISGVVALYLGLAFIEMVLPDRIPTV